MNRVVTVYAEVTPNPNTMKFVTDVMLVNGGETAEFRSASEAQGHSKMAEQLFNFPFVTSLFFANNFVTVTKTEALSWDLVANELRTFVKEWVENNDSVIEKMPAHRELETTSREGNSEIVSEAPELNTEIDRTIYNLLEEYVKPAVESDGGAIDFKGFDEVTGIVTVILRGSCSGCPSSTATLKGGIESLLKTHCPEVQEVVALNG